ncbi:Uncharacterised protein [BD1-7 clade bacterium]|uniref:DUF4265 domain-containing protein n=1 Tax=BD1-7 clade bacterium TaxID=2029982 RepID=A0A5S9QEA9_9GAMM|nr:Uncharacterised protein [BD1-7 clade bacterium]
MSEETLIHLLAGQRPDGELVYEDVRAEVVGDGCYRLLASPVFARGSAKGDVIRMMAAGRFEVEGRGGKLCVRVLGRGDLSTVRQRLEAPVKAIEGELDFDSERALVYNVPVEQGFDAVENAFNEALQGRDDAMWLYANVYDPVDGETPLNWWHDYLAK